MLAVLAAMTEEIAPLRERLGARELYHNRVVRIEQTRGGLLLVQTGIGKANAAAAAAILLAQYQSEALLNIGSAGGFARDLRFGDIVVGEECCYSDADATCFGYRPGQVPQMPPGYAAAERLLAAAREAARQAQFAPYVRFGQILTSDAFMSDPARADRLRGLFPRALAADMEGCAIAQVAYSFGVPFLNLRSISDIAGERADKSFDDNLGLAAKRAAGFVLAALEQLGAGNITEVRQ